MRARIQVQLAASYPATLVTELLNAFDEAKRNFYLGGTRLAEVEGGRFCEAALRMLQHATNMNVTPLGKQLPRVDDLIRSFEQQPASAFHDSIRLHIPRSLRVVYDIRNKRDVAHLGDGIDPNLQDATLVISVLDWILAEFVRLSHGSMSPDDAQRMVEDIVTRACPVVQDFDGFLKILNTKLSASECCLVLLYQRGTEGATRDQLCAWVRPTMRRNLQRTLGALVHKKAYVHKKGDLYVITREGQRVVESQHLLQ